EVCAAAEDHGIRLRDRSELGQLKRALNAGNPLGLQVGQEVAKIHDTEEMRVLDRRHLNDLPADELQPGIRGERSIVPRVLELLDRPKLLLNRHRHEPPPTSILRSLRGREPIPKCRRQGTYRSWACDTDEHGPARTGHGRSLLT